MLLDGANSNALNASTPTSALANFATNAAAGNHHPQRPQPEHGGRAGQCRPVHRWHGQHADRGHGAEQHRYLHASTGLAQRTTIRQQRHAHRRRQRAGKHGAEQRPGARHGRNAGGHEGHHRHQRRHHHQWRCHARPVGFVGGQHRARADRPGLAEPRRPETSRSTRTTTTPTSAAATPSTRGPVSAAGPDRRQRRFLTLTGNVTSTAPTPEPEPGQRARRHRKASFQVQNNGTGTGHPRRVQTGANGASITDTRLSASRLATLGPSCRWVQATSLSPQPLAPRAATLRLTPRGCATSPTFHPDHHPNGFSWAGAASRPAAALHGGEPATSESDRTARTARSPPGTAPPLPVPNVWGIDSVNASAGFLASNVPSTALVNPGALAGGGAPSPRCQRHGQWRGRQQRHGDRQFASDGTAFDAA